MRAAMRGVKLCDFLGSKKTILLCISLSVIPFAVSQCLPTGLYARYIYESWDSTALIWKNTVGSGSDATGSGSGFSKNCYTNVNGASGRVCEVRGTIESIIRFGTMPASYTICTVARYSGISRRRIFTSSAEPKNWLHGFWDSKRGVAYNGDWMTSSSNLIPAIETDWLTFCSQNQAPYLHFANDVSVGLGLGGTGNFDFGVNTWYNEFSDFAIMEISIWSRSLSEAEIRTVTSIYNAILGGSVNQTFPSACQPLKSQPRNLARSCGTDSNQDCTAAQSSVASWWGMDAHVVVDGSKTEAHDSFSGLFYGSHTNTDTYPWIKIDMVTSREIGSGQLWNRPDDCASRLDGFQIWIGDSPSYNGLNNINCYTATTTPHNYFPYVHYFPCVGSGRYFFVCIPRTSTWLHLREIEIYPPCSNGQTATEPYALLAHNYQSIRKLAVATREVTTVVGNAYGISGSSDGVGTSGRFQNPRGVATSADGTFILVADLRNKMVRRVDLFTRTVTTVAGSTAAYSVSDGIGTLATFDSPFGVAISPDGAIAVVTEIDAHVVRKITLLTGQVATLAGLASSRGSVDGIGTNCRFSEPAHIAIEPDGRYALIPEWGNHVIRRVDISTAAVTTLVGTKARYGNVDGFGAAAMFSKPCGIAISPDGFFALVTDINNYVIRKIVISTKSVTTLAGAKNVEGTMDGRGTSSRFKYANEVALSPDGWFAIVTDAYGQAIRFITVDTGDVNTVAGSIGYSGMADGVGLAAQFYDPEGAAVNSASCPTGLFLAPCGFCSSGTYRANCTWTSPGICAACDTCPVGQYRSGCTGTSPGTCLCSASSGTYPLTLRDGSSCQCGRLEVSYNGVWGTVCDDYFDSADATVVCKQLQLVSGNVMPTVREGTNAIWMDDLACVGVEATLSTCQFRGWGSHDCSHSEDVSVCCCVLCPSGQYSSGCSGSSSGSCVSCAACPAGKFRVRCSDSSAGYCTSCLTLFALVADSDNHIIRRIQWSSGVVSTLAGTKQVSGSADGIGTTAYFSTPASIVISPDGETAYITDTWNHAIRRLIISTGYVDTFAGSKGISGSADGIWSSAQFNAPVALALSPDGSLIFVADTYNQIIRAISRDSRFVSTLAGFKTSAGTADGYGTSARFYNPRGIAISPDGEFAVVSDTDNYALRIVVISSGAVTTLAGVKGSSGSVDGIGSAARFTQLTGLAISPTGLSVLVADFGNHAIRKIVIGSRAVTTLVGSLGVSGTADGIGTFARFKNPYSVSISADGLVALVPEYGNNAIRHIELDTNSVTVLAGSPGLSGSQDGVGSSARFSGVRGINVPPNPSVCLAGQFLEGCQVISPGACVWCSPCPAGAYRSSCSRLSAGTCQNCSSCNIGQYNYGCGGLFLGTCTECPLTTCPSGQYLRGCSGTSGGVCDLCSGCNAGQYRSGCSGLSPGACQPCVTCSSNEYVSGCGGSFQGICVACTTCQQGQYISGCAGTSGGLCTACNTSCPSGTYRRNCGGAFAGTCAACEVCPGSQVRTGCLGISPGVCINSECTVCQADQYLVGCSGIYSGLCMNCNSCPKDQYRKNCGGNSSGECIECKSILCPANSYRVGCNYTSMGTCSMCEICPTGQFRINCSGISDGVCTDCDQDQCPWGHYRRGCLGTSEGSCVACNPCPVGMFRVQCSGLSEGRCEACNCSDGLFRKNCSGLVSGTCVGCESCPQGQYRSACSGINPGICLPCEACTAGKFRDMCGRLSGGICTNCTQCPINTFCRSASGRESCSICEVCPDGQYRQGCFGISGGSCSLCDACSSNMYRANCSGLASGYCAPCSSAQCESEGQYRVGCGGLYIGYCTLCETCPNGMYRSGCNGTSPGFCTSCMPCPAGKQRKGCGRTNAGSCQDCSTPNTYALVADASAGVLRRITISSREVETVAGLSGIAGSVDGTGSNARFFNPVIATYIPAKKVIKALLTDQLNHVVRHVDLQSGSVTTLAGTKGIAGTLDGSGTYARFNQPFGIVVSSFGELAYVSEYAGHVVRSIHIKTGFVATGAGAKGMNGSLDGQGTQSRFFNPCGLAIANDNINLFLVDSSNHLIRRIDVNTWQTTTLAGTAGTQGSADGVGTVATFSFPQDVAVSPDGYYLYVTDRDNNKLRRININTQSTITLKTSSSLSKPSFISLASDGLYALVCETLVPSIKRVGIDTGVVTALFAGNPVEGIGQDSLGSSFQSPSGIMLLPQEPRRIAQITSHVIDYVHSLKIEFLDGNSIDYILGRGNANSREIIRTNFSLEDGECIKMVELKVDTSSNVQGIAFSTSSGNSFSVRGSKYGDNGEIMTWRSSTRECILGFELEASNSAQLITNVIKECVLCLPGTFISAVVNQSGETEDICSSCPAGKFSNESRAIQCVHCDTGTFSKRGGTVCSKCETKPPGTFSADGSFNSTCIYQETSRYVNGNSSCLWECLEGYYKNADYCLRCRDSSTACAVSEYLSLCSLSENAKCKPCINKPPNSVYTKQGYITSNCSWKCDQNYYFASSACHMCNSTPCPLDTYTVPCKENSDRICAPCANYKPPNSIYNGPDRAGSEICRWECSAGFFCSNISKYISCYDANSTCSRCSRLNCSEFLVACTAVSDASCVSYLCTGREDMYYRTPKNLPIGSPGGSCVPCTQIMSANKCQRGFYRIKCTQFEDSECIECTNGPQNCGSPESGCLYNSDGNLENNFSCGWNCRPGMHVGESSCADCPAGKYENNGICVDCLVGQYSSSAASESCQLCGKGTYSTVPGASSVSMCKSCEAGKYQDVQGETCCKDCRVNSYSGVLGAISETVCVSCPESPVPTTTDGRTGQIFLHNCLCPKRFLGNVSDYYRHQKYSTDCLACPRGLKCSGDEQIEPVVKNSTWILNSSFGYVLESCPAGYYYRRDPNFFSFFRSIQESQECIPCSKGFDCANPPCQACSMCSLGKYKACDGTDDCQECPADTYADTNASLECKKCPVGMSTMGLSYRTSIHDCVCSENSYAIAVGMDCQICPPGLRCYGNLKEPEPKPLTVAPNLDGHVLDSSLHVGISNWTKERQYWKLIYCPPGFRMFTIPAVDYKDQECVACGRGEDCHPDRAPCTECLTCPQGKYKSDRYFYQTKVPRSYFSPQDASFVREWVAEPCENCPADTYRNREGGTERGSCTLCPARSTTLGISGKTSIFDCICDNQFYMVNLSATEFECQVCPKGAVCSGRSRACALRTNPPSCPCVGEDEYNSSGCDNNVPGSWVVEQVSRRGSSARRTILRLSVCPPGYMLFKDDVYPDLDECQKCNSGKYSLLPTKISVNSGNISCLLCPFGAKCPGGNEVTAKNGFWRDFSLSNSSLAVIYACPPGACDENNRCTKNRIGEICGYCPRGFALTVTGCTKCPEPKTLDSARTIVTVVTIIILLALWTGVSCYKIGARIEPKQNTSRDLGRNQDTKEERETIDHRTSESMAVFKISSDVKTKISAARLTGLVDILKDFVVSPNSNTKMVSLINNNLNSTTHDEYSSFAPVVIASAVDSSAGTSAPSHPPSPDTAITAAGQSTLKVKVHRFKLGGEDVRRCLRGPLGSVDVTDRFVVLTIPMEGFEISGSESESLFSMRTQHTSAGGGHGFSALAAPSIVEDISNSSAAASAHAASAFASADDYSQCANVFDDGTGHDSIDFDHFIIYNKVYISRARFWEALAGNPILDTCFLFIKFQVQSTKTREQNTKGEKESEQEIEEGEDGPGIETAEDEHARGTEEQNHTNEGDNSFEITNCFKTYVLNPLRFTFTVAEEIYLIQYCKIFLTYFQILGAFWTFDVDWPDLLISTMKWASYIFQFDIFHAPNVSCFWAEASFLTKLMAYTLLPFVACSILYVVPLCIWHYYYYCYSHFLTPTFPLWFSPVTEPENAKNHVRNKNEVKPDSDARAQIEKRKEIFMDLFWQSTMVLIFFVYPVVSLTILQAFDCRPGADTAGNNGLNKLSVNMREKCPGSESLVRIWAGIFMLIYPIGLPLFVAYCMYNLRVPEIAEHAVSSEIIISMIRECVQDCTTPEYSRLSTIWKSRQPAESQESIDHLSGLVSSCIHKFEGKGGFSPEEAVIEEILDSNCASSEKFESIEQVTTSVGTDREKLNSRMQRVWNTATLFTGAENGLLPYLTDLQLEVLFWWSQIKLFESNFSRLKNYAAFQTIVPCANPSKENDFTYSQFKEDSLSKLCKHIHSLKMEKETGSIPSHELYKAVVKNGSQLIKRFNIAYESPVWCKSQPKHVIGHLTVDERRNKSLYSMSAKEIEEMRYAALSSVGIVFASYKMEFWYWELIEMFRK